MIKVNVNRIGFNGQTGEAIVLLDEPNEQKVLPICIGLLEANAISLALYQQKSSRPLTHELLFCVIQDLGYLVDKVEITEIKDNAFYASVFLRKQASGRFKKTTLKKIDARPSDAIALALRSEAPIYVDRAVLEQAAVSAEAIVRQTAGDTRDFQDEKKFKQFLQEVKASDFKLRGKPPEAGESEGQSDVSGA